MAWSYRKEASLRLPSLRVPRLRVAAAWEWLAGLSLAGRVALVVLVLIGLVLLVGAFTLFLLFGPVAIPRELPDATAASSTIYAADGTVLATWHGPIDRRPVPLDQMSPYLAKAVVAEEDARFYSEPAVDWRAILRAALTDIQAGHVLEGGSTLTQQYVKEAYVGSKPTLSRKLLEARVALQLNRTLTKDQIMERYLNTVYFGDGAYGVEAAAQVYFGEDAAKITVSQAAMLAGIIHSPDHDAPNVNPGAADADRLRVIGRMQALRFITPEQAAQARGDTAVLVSAVVPNQDVAWFLDAVRTSMIQQYGAATVYRGGLQVHTTLDPSAQAAAQGAMTAALPSASDPYAAVVSVDPATGYVKAILGGRNYSQQQFNIATMGRRQPGSAFKPFVLATALEQGISASAVYNGPATLCLNGWTPGCVSNFGGESFGPISLTDATVNSVNTVYAQLILQVGAQNVAATASRMGIPGPVDVVPPQVGCRPLGSPSCQTYLPAVPSLALGSAAVTPLEMASAYATLAAGGVYRAPKLVSEVRDGSGKVLDSGPSPGVQAIPGPVADEVTQILQQVITRGTGAAAGIGQPAAGKTGTAQNFDNAWFVGYTPTLASAVWVGDRDSNQPLLNVEGVKQVTGGTIPAHIWSQYMQMALDTTPPTLYLAAGLADASLTNQTAQRFAGRAADQTGNVVRVEASLDGGPYVTASVTCAGCPGRSVTWAYATPSLPDGTHTLAIRAVDLAGRVSSLLSRSFTVDTVPPALTGVSATGGAAGIGVTFSKPVLCSTLSPSAFSVSVRGRATAPAVVGCSGAVAPSVTLTAVSAPRGGDQVGVSVLAPFRGGPTDQAGNPFGAGRSASVTATNVPPVLSVDGGPADGALTNATQPAWTGSASDPDGAVAAIEASVDAAPATGAPAASGAGTTPWTWRVPSRLADGTHTVAFRSVDNAGARSPVVTRTVTVDTVPPKLVSLAATGGSPVVAAGFSKPLSCPAAPAGLVATVSGRAMPVASIACGTTTTAQVTLTLTGAPRGGDSVVVSASPSAAGPTDVAGNHVAPGALAVTAANQPPVVAVTGGLPASGLTNQAQPALQGTDSDPDGTVAAIAVSVDGAPAVTVAQPPGRQSWSWRAPGRLPDGVHVLAVTAIDNAGAPSAPAGALLTIDTAAPTVSGVTATGGSTSLTVTFSKPVVCAGVVPGAFAVTAGGRSDLVYTADCTGSAATSTVLTLANPVRGGDVVTVGPAGGGAGPADEAGNTLGGTRATATAANVPPSLAVTSAPVLGASSDASPAFGGTATDADGTVVGMQASIDGGPFRGNGFTCQGCSGGPTVGGPTAWSYRPPRLGDGPHTIALLAMDNAGATSTVVSETVIIDTSAPRLTGVTATAGDALRVSFSKPVLCSSLNVGEFDVTTADVPAIVTGIACPDGEDASVSVTLLQPPAAGDAVSLTVSRGIADGTGRPVRLPAPAVSAAVAPG